MSNKELNVLTQMELKKFQSECEILKLRREEFLKRTNDIDDQIDKLIHQADVSSAAHKRLLDRWLLVVKHDVERIESKWIKKLDGMRKAFDRDNEFLQNHQKTRVKTNTSTCSPTISDKMEERVVTASKDTMSITFNPSSSEPSTTINVNSEKNESVPVASSSHSRETDPNSITNDTDSNSLEEPIRQVNETKVISPSKNCLTQSSNHPPLKKSSSPRKLRSSTSPKKP